MLFVHDDYDDIIMMMIHDSTGSDIWLCGLKRELKHNLTITDDKILTY